MQEVEILKLKLTGVEGRQRTPAPKIAERPEKEEGNGGTIAKMKN